MKEETEKINQADTMVFQTEKQLKEYGEKLSPANKENIEKALSQLKDAHKERNVAGIDTAMAALNTAWQAASQEMYNATNASSTANPQPDAGANAEAPTGEAAQDNVTDVDYEEVKDEKK